MDKVAEVLAGLREEKAKLAIELSRVERAISALEEVMGGEPGQGRAAQPAPAPAAAPPAPPAEVKPPGPYASDGFYEAAAKYLAMAGEPKTSREIAEALLAGGYPTKAEDFPGVARTMLRRQSSANPYGISMSEDERSFFFRETDPDQTP